MMKSILIFGAGRSSSALIDYLLAESEANNWTVVVADVSLAAAEHKIDGHRNGRAVAIDIQNAELRGQLVAAADCVASLMPPHLHDIVAADCLEHGKHLVTASYLSPAFKAMAAEVKAKNLLFMGELGLDPGIDHLSAMKIIDEVEENGGVVTSLKSYCGGLVAPECEGDNAWGYKFTWNPMNVVLAGKGAAQYLENGKLKCKPYTRIFKETSVVNVPTMGAWDGYVNRDSVQYRELYGLHDVETLIRGTLRKRGFCKTWDIFIQLGMTDENYVLDCKNKTYNDFLEYYLPSNAENENGVSLRDRLRSFLHKGEKSNCIKKIEWLGFFDNQAIPLDKGTPAEILLSLLLKKWQLAPDDHDLVIMQHEFEYKIAGKNYRHTSAFIVKGENTEDTAMAKHVGLPMAVMTKLLMQNKIALRGVHIPTQKEVYSQILPELAQLGVVFQEEVVEID